MLQRLFSTVLNMSLTGSIAIGCVLAARLALKRAPRIFSYLLWAGVLFRLLCPVSLSSGVSVLNLAPVPRSGELVDAVEYVPVTAEPIPIRTDRTEEARPETVSFDWQAAAAGVWAWGVAAVAGYGVHRYGKLKRKLCLWAHVERGVRAVDGIGSPFVLGLLRPMIYLPSELSDGERRYMLLHERHHIRRGDHIVKFLSTCALCLHWFNPLVWLAFTLADRDMEMSCDEAVLRRLGPEIRADYAQSLLDLATGRRVGLAPLAFGEGDTGDRVRHVLGWKKAARWVLPVGAAICLLVLAVTMLNPAQSPEDPSAALPPETTMPTEAVILDGERPQLQSGWYAVREDSLDALTTGVLRIWIRLDPDGTGELRINSDSFALKWDAESLLMTHENLDHGDRMYKMHYTDMLIHGVPHEYGLALFLVRSRLLFDYTGDALPEQYLEPPVEPGIYGYVDHLCWTEENEKIVYGEPLTDGDVEQGWLELKEDGTGTLSYGGVTREFRWEGDYLYTEDTAIHAQAWMELMYYDYIGSLRADNEQGIKLKLEEEGTFLYLRRIPE